MKRRIVIALGGNALGDNLFEQMAAVEKTAVAIADLIEGGCEVVIAHGNGPQVGMINLALECAGKTEAKTPFIPMSMCVAMSQGYIGYDLQNALREELLSRGMEIPVATVVTQTIVDSQDPAFKHPTKPIGAFYTQQEADEMVQRGINMMEDAGRGYRRVVASPKPVDIVEKETVKALLAAGQIVIAAGGGGIPVMQTGRHRSIHCAPSCGQSAPAQPGQTTPLPQVVAPLAQTDLEQIDPQSDDNQLTGVSLGLHLKGASAVVDKDFAAARLAEIIEADFLVILTAVEKVAINFRQPNEKWLSDLTVQQAQRYIDEGHFAPGSMLPKIQAAMQFAASGTGRSALITLLDKAKDGIEGKTGTTIRA